MIAQRPPPDAAYYQQLHDANPAFQRNNWLLDEIDALRAFGTKSIIEVGCGNGQFLALAADHWQQVVGLDWARAPAIDAVLAAKANVRFVQADIVAAAFDQRFGTVASADFLEHLEPEVLPRVVAALLRLGDVNYHKIACYDDGHSHLSIFEPARWLEIFCSAPGGTGARILRDEPRKGQADKRVIVISTR